MLLNILLILICITILIVSVIVDEIQVASYKMLGSLYTLGTDVGLTHDRKYLKTEIERHKPALVSTSMIQYLGIIM